MTESIGVVYRETDGTTPVEFARCVEELAYDSLWVSEGWGRNTVALLAEIAAGTETVTVGSAILNVFSRTPALLAMTGASIQRISGGRFVLGLGVSHPELVESLHGLTYERPIQRMAETVELIGAFTDPDSGSVEYDGEVFSVEGYEPLDCEIPVYNAALGPSNRRLTGATCDGWMPNQIPVGRLEADFDLVAEGARSAGRSPDDVAVSPWVPAIIHGDEAVAMDMMRKGIAGYAGRFSAYHDAIATSHPDVAEAVSTAWQAGDSEAAAAAVTDDLVTDMGIVGPPDQARERLADVAVMSVVDTPVVAVPTWVDAAVADRTIRELAPATLQE